MSTQQEHESIELLNVPPASSSQPAPSEPVISATAIDELPPEYPANAPSTTQPTSPPSPDGPQNTNARGDAPHDAYPAHAYPPPPAADQLPTDGPLPPGELLPSYTYVTAPPPKYAEKNIFKLLRSRELRMTILGTEPSQPERPHLILCNFLQPCFCLEWALQLRSSHSQPSLDQHLATQPSMCKRCFLRRSLVHLSARTSGGIWLGTSTLESRWSTECRLSMEQARSCPLKRTILGECSSFLVVWKLKTVDLDRLFPIETGTTVSYMAPYSADTFYALATSNGTVNLGEYSIVAPSGTTARPVSVFNLTNITSPAFVHPVVEASMYLSIRYSAALNKTQIFVALGDTNSTTWVYRIRVPGYIVERNATISASARGVYRFADTVGFGDADSNELVSSILMLPSAPAPTIYDAYAMLLPQNLSLVYPQNFYHSSNDLFLGAPYRASLSGAGTSGIVMGDKALVAANSAELNRNISAGTNKGQVFEVFPPNYWESSFRSYIGGNLTEVLVHASGKYTISGVDSSLQLDGTRTTSLYNSTTHLTAFGRADIGFEVESLANAGLNGFYAMGANGTTVVIGKYTVQDNSS
ncbi:hypothetical protein BJ742DRAFT_835251 [Cladochytrium replicatum]|nr:hypothetical protein BJ742DRAFT_835251 [Cladochytrium replicatum]